MTLTGKQKRYLRGLAHNIKPLFQVGKQGVNQHFINQINEYIEIHELVKISVLQNCPIDKYEVADDVGNATNSKVVQIIGNTIILYKESVDNKGITLP